MRTVQLAGKVRGIATGGVNSTSGSLNDNAAISMGAGQAFTVAAWCRMGAVSGGIVAKGQNNTAATAEYAINFNPSGQFEAIISDGTTRTLATQATVRPLGIWHFAAAVYDNVNISMSVNGGAFTSTAHATGAQDGTGQFQIGSRGDGGIVMKGVVRCVGLWKRALSLAELVSLYNSGKPLRARELTTDILANIVDYWTLSNSLVGYFGGNPIVYPMTGGGAAQMAASYPGQ
jgi:hypothetical protein